MNQCGIKTLKGEPCRRNKLKDKDTCHIHQKPKECSICLSSIFRGSRTLPCNHTFHISCIDRWKRQGNYTCPVCRKEFDLPEYNVTIIIECRRTRERFVTQNLPSSQPIGIRFSEMFDLPRDNSVEYVTNINLEATEEELLHVLAEDLGLNINQIIMPNSINGGEPPAADAE